MDKACLAVKTQDFKYCYSEEYFVVLLECLNFVTLYGFKNEKKTRLESKTDTKIVKNKKARTNRDSRMDARNSKN